MSFERLGQELAREQDLLRAHKADRSEVRRSLLALPEGSFFATRSQPVLAAALGTVVVAAAAAVLWARPVGERPAPEPLFAKLEGSERAIVAGAFLEAPAGEPLGLRFSDRTRLEMGAGARARLVELAPAGAHVLLESGQAHVEVVHRTSGRFRVSAGPFVVHVKGTRFDVRWEPEQDRFELDLERGQVEVSGCVFGQGYRLRAGQRLHASCKRGHFDVLERRQEGSAPNAPTAPPAASTTVALAAEPARAPERGALELAAPQATQSRSTHAPLAPQSEFERRCQRASAEQLARFADEARYGRNFGDEAYALRLLRRRFAGTPPGALAAFALGRLEFDVRGGYRKAAEWFGTYLREEPSGPLAREARGRLMEATFQAGDLPRARALAQSYLSEYPRGPHAELARSLQSSESSR